MLSLIGGGARENIEAGWIGAHLPNLPSLRSWKNFTAFPTSSSPGQAGNGQPEETFAIICDLDYFIVLFQKLVIRICKR
jgi:hypothetical protein